MQPVSPRQLWTARRAYRAAHTGLRRRHAHPLAVRRIVGDELIVVQGVLMTLDVRDRSVAQDDELARQKSGDALGDGDLGAEVLDEGRACID